MTSNPEELLAKANKRATSSGGFASFFGGGSSKYEEARELFRSAANAFKLDRRWKDSGDAFCKAGEMSIKADERDDAANDYWDASKSYKKSNPELAVAALQKNISILVERGRFRQAADRQKEVGQIYQQDGTDLQAAWQAFDQAGEWYSAEDAHATANGCFKEVAEICALVDNFDKAIQRFEQVAAACLDSRLTRYSIKEYFLKAGLCHLCKNDLVSTRRAMDNYVQMDNTFPSTREYQFLSNITDTIEAGDHEAFTAALMEYDKLSKFDNWMTTILLKIKNTIQEEPGLT